MIRNVQSIDFLHIALVLLGGGLTVALLRRVMPHLVRRFPARFRHDLLPLQSLLRLMIYVAVLWQIVGELVVPTRENVLALLAASALGLGFAFKDYLSSLLAGVVALSERTYRLGDRVTIGDTYGEVRGIHLRAVKIVTPDDTVVYVPHEKIWSEKVANANDGARTMLCVAEFYLHSEHDARSVRQKLIDVALTSPYIDLDHDVHVRAAEQPWGTLYKLKAYVLDNRDEFAFTTDLTLRAKDSLARLGVKPARVPAITAAS